MLERKAYQELLDWKNKRKNENLKKCLIVKGARQVGKTYLIKKFGEKEYESFISIDFYEHPELKAIFDGELTSEAIYKRISICYEKSKGHPGRGRKGAFELRVLEEPSHYACRPYGRGCSGLLFPYAEQYNHRYRLRYRYGAQRPDSRPQSVHLGPSAQCGARRAGGRDRWKGIRTQVHCSLDFPRPGDGPVRTDMSGRETNSARPDQRDGRPLVRPVLFRADAQLLAGLPLPHQCLHRRT